MQPFNYSRATAIEKAIALCSQDTQTKFIAGGTTLIDLMKLYVETPSELIDINSLPLAAIETTDNGVRIGAMAKMSEVAAHPLIKSRFFLISQALEASASPQLRNMASIGGNLMQRTRCPYFRDTAFPCNKRLQDSGCPAKNGENRMHAILGTSNSCYATHASDLAVALMALDAVIQTQSQTGKRSIPLGEFYLTPGNTPSQETVLQPGELITAVDVPQGNFTQHYLKIRDRASYEFAIVSAAVAIFVENKKIKTARIALGGVGTKPWRCLEAENILVGNTPNKEILQQAAASALQGAQPLGQNAFKVELAKRTLISALETVCE